LLDKISSHPTGVKIVILMVKFSHYVVAAALQAKSPLINHPKLLHKLDSIHSENGIVVLSFHLYELTK